MELWSENNLSFSLLHFGRSCGMFIRNVISRLLYLYFSFHFFQEGTKHFSSNPFTAIYKTIKDKKLIIVSCRFDSIDLWNVSFISINECIYDQIKLISAQFFELKKSSQVQCNRTATLTFSAKLSLRAQSFCILY